MTVYAGTEPGVRSSPYIFIVAESASHPWKSRWPNGAMFPGNMASPLLRALPLPPGRRNPVCKAAAKKTVPLPSSCPPPPPQISPVGGGSPQTRDHKRIFPGGG